MKIVYAQSDFPKEVTKTIFLAGPTPRDPSVEGWRGEALAILDGLGFDGHVFVPEPFKGDKAVQIEWEEEGLHRADCIVFWVPRDVTGEKFWTFPMPGLTTNDEWGFWKDSGKVVLGVPSFAENTSYQLHYANKYGVPTFFDLKRTLDMATRIVGDGARRIGGECCVPLYIWNKPEFQDWYLKQRAVGNTLNGARQIWTLHVPQPAFNGGTPKFLLSYALHVNIHVASEKRDKVNEFVLFRPDISSILMYHGDEIVLVKEFRSTVRNNSGFVRELPGGSSIKPGQDARAVAASEVEEETGLKVAASRFQDHGSRQLLSTFSAHTSHLFSVELTQNEIEILRRDRSAHGVSGESERTYVEVVSLSKILDGNLVDWSTVGMIMSIVRP